MVVKITSVLKRKLEERNHNSQKLIDSFKEWKMGDEYDSYDFGKDSFYHTPPVNGERYVLRHVHLVPMQDLAQLALWDRDWKFRRRKTSNRVLVYVSDNHKNSLLITILDEPSAHDVALMKTQEDSDLMKRFALIAEAFLNDGSIIA